MTHHATNGRGEGAPFGFFAQKKTYFAEQPARECNCSTNIPIDWPRCTPNKNVAKKTQQTQRFLLSDTGMYKRTPVVQKKLSQKSASCIAARVVAGERVCSASMPRYMGVHDRGAPPFFWGSSTIIIGA